MTDTERKIRFLESYGFTVGDRDARLNTNYAGDKMVVEATIEDLDNGDYELPTEDGSNGPWCVVGDNIEELVDTAHDYLLSLADDYNKITENWKLAV